MKVAMCLRKDSIDSHPIHSSVERLEVGKEYEVDESNTDRSRIRIFMDGTSHIFYKERFSEPYESTSVDLVTENSISKQFEEKVKLMLNVHNKGNSTESGEC